MMHIMIMMAQVVRVAGVIPPGCVEVSLSNLTANWLWRTCVCVYTAFDDGAV